VRHRKTDAPVPAGWPRASAARPPSSLRTPAERRMVREDTGVVHQHTDTLACGNFLPQPLHLRRVSEVSLDERMSIARQGALRCLRSCSVRAVVQNDTRPAPRHDLTDRRTDPTGGPGNQNRHARCIARARHRDSLAPRPDLRDSPSRLPRAPALPSMTRSRPPRENREASARIRRSSAETGRQ